MSKIYVFGGGKGGVGKSTGAIAFHHARKAAGGLLIVREGDATNPDVARALGCDAEAGFSPAEIGDWSNILQQAAQGDVLVNLPGGGDQVFLENAAAIGEAAKTDGNEVVFISTLNRSRECVVILKSNLDLLAGTAVRPAVVVNEFFGDASKFARFNKSKTREQLLAQGGAEIVLPELAEFVIDAVISPSGRELETAPTLAKSIFSTWLKKVDAAFSVIV